MLKKILVKIFFIDVSNLKIIKMFKIIQILDLNLNNESSLGIKESYRNEIQFFIPITFSFLLNSKKFEIFI